MKKIISMILATAMVVAMATALTACGEKPASETASTTQPAAQTTVADTTTTVASSVFPEALSAVQAIQFSDVSQTAWEFKGGMINGVEMESTDVDATLAACGGALQFAFVDGSTAQLLNGQQSFEGTYEVIQDNFAIHAVFEGYEYYGVFTKVEDQTILILSNVASPEVALYMAQMAV